LQAQTSDKARPKLAALHPLRKDDGAAAGAGGAMRFTSRQYYMTRVLTRSLPVAIVLGALYSHARSPETGLTGYLDGALAGILITISIVLLEFYVFSGPVLRRAPFLLYLGVRSLAYLVAIVVGLALSGHVMLGMDMGAMLLERRGVLFSLALGVGFNLVFGVNRLLGPGVLFNFVAGRYHRPRVEERVFAFIDMASSTAIAERLGETGFLDFLNRFVADMTGPIVAERGEIHKYVGDEIIVSWPLAAGVGDARCIRACFDALATLDALAEDYIGRFGCRAGFRAALHCGPVVVGELGIVKMEIAFVGDTMNTTARLQQACRDTGNQVIASAALIDRLDALPPGIAKHTLGPLRLRGKEEEIAAYALYRAAAKTTGIAA
jgi:adenylate cyclase